MFFVNNMTNEYVDATVCLGVFVSQYREFWGGESIQKYL